MNILFPYQWLKQHSAIKASPQQMAEKLCLHSHSVEKIEKIEGESVLDIETTANRPDCFGVIGMAREIAVLFGKKIKTDPSLKPSAFPVKSTLPLKIINNEPKYCRRIFGIIIKDIKVESSPAWLKKRLQQIGIRPINNIVDITNFVMRETGQPLHAFDYDQIKGQQIKIRLSKKGEKLELLDDQIVEFNQPALVMQDKERIIDLMGIMGGKNSAVTSKTKTIFLQAPSLQASLIRQTWRKFNLHTDAAILFEKDLDPRACEPALFSAIKLVQKISQGKIASQLIDSYPQKIKEKSIDFDLSYIERILGLVINKKEVIKILENLGFTIASKEKKILKVKVPYWRHNDIKITEDLIEEVGRIYGYHNLPSHALSGVLPKTEHNLAKQIRLEERTKDLLKDFGLIEVLNYSLTSEKNAFISADFNTAYTLEQSSLKDAPIRIHNPLSNEFEYMRTALLPGLLETAQKNQKTVENIKIFELSKVYLAQKEAMPAENVFLSLLISGEKSGFYYLKGILEKILQEFGITADYKHMPPNNLLEPKKSASLAVNHQKIGALGQISQTALKKYNLKKQFFGLEIAFEKLIEFYDPNKKFKGIAKFPAIFLDLSAIVKKSTLWHNLEKEILKAGQPLLKKVEVFDVYQGGKIPKNCRSIAFHLEYRSKTHSLKIGEAEKAQKKVINQLNKIGVEIRTK